MYAFHWLFLLTYYSTQILWNTEHFNYHNRARGAHWPYHGCYLNSSNNGMLVWKSLFVTQGLRVNSIKINSYFFLYFGFHRLSSHLRAQPSWRLMQALQTQRCVRYSVLNRLTSSSIEYWCRKASPHIKSLTPFCLYLSSFSIMHRQLELGRQKTDQPQKQVRQLSRHRWV